MNEMTATIFKVNEKRLERNSSGVEMCHQWWYRDKGTLGYIGMWNESRKEWVTPPLPKHIEEIKDLIDFIETYEAINS